MEEEEKEKNSQREWIEIQASPPPLWVQENVAICKEKFSVIRQTLHGENQAALSIPEAFKEVWLAEMILHGNTVSGELVSWCFS